MHTSTIEMTIDQASQSKAAFVQFLHHIEIAECAPWVIGWVEKFFTDEMANNFPKFYNGGYDDQAITLPSGEVLPSLVDDIEECMAAYPNKPVQIPSFTYIPEALINDIQAELSM